MGDEVIYFVQGHQLYVDAVKTNNVYRIDVDRNQPWHKMAHIRVCASVSRGPIYILISLVSSFSLPFNELSLVGLALDVVD